MKHLIITVLTIAAFAVSTTQAQSSVDTAAVTRQYLAIMKANQAIMKANQARQDSINNEIANQRGLQFSKLRESQENIWNTYLVTSCIIAAVSIIGIVMIAK